MTDWDAEGYYIDRAGSALPVAPRTRLTDQRTASKHPALFMEKPPRLCMDVFYSSELCNLIVPSTRILSMTKDR